MPQPPKKKSTPRKKSSSKGGKSSVLVHLKTSSVGHSVPQHPADLADDLSLYGPFNSYCKLLLDKFAHIHLFEMAAVRDSPTNVPISSLFVRPALLKQHLPPSSASEEALEKGFDLLETLKGYNHLVVLGDPGAGKTTLINWLIYTLADPRNKELSHALTLPSSNHLFPIPLVLREAFQRDPEIISQSSADTAGLLRLFLAQPFAEALREGPAHELLNLTIAASRTFLLLDGIDELPPDHRRWLRDAFAHFSARYPDSFSIATSRVVGYSNCPFDHESSRQKEKKEARDEVHESSKIEKDLDIQEVSSRTKSSDDLQAVPKIALRYTAPFNEERIREFVQRWYSLRSSSRSTAADTALDFTTRLQESPGTKHLRHSPILLTYMAIIFQAYRSLPDGRSELYAKIAETYLTNIPRRRNLSVPCEAEEAGYWLAEIAFHMQLLRTKGEKKQRDKSQNPAILVPQGQMLAWLDDALVNRPSRLNSDLSSVELLEYLSGRAGLLLPKGTDQEGLESYSFTHLSFQEFFAALHISRHLSSYAETHQTRPDLIPPSLHLSKLREYANDERWTETFVLLFELLSSSIAPPIRPAVLLGYLLDPANKTKPARNWLFLDGGSTPALPTKNATSQTALVLLCALLRDRFIDFSPLVQSLDPEEPNPLLSQLTLAATSALVDQSKGHFWETSSPLVRAYFSLPNRVQLLTEIFANPSVGKLKNCNLSAVGISDFTDIDFPESLVGLQLSNNQISNISKLKLLGSLQRLWLNGNLISDTSKLELPTSLKSLSLNDNQISDPSKLKFPDSITELFIDYNRISNPSKLRLPASLTRLDLDSNQISNPSKLKLPSSLKTLYLQDNQISDPSKLKLPNSLTILHLNRNQISDCSKLKLPKSLKSLYLSGNQISDLSKLSIPASITALSLSRNQIYDLSKVKLPNSLAELDLAGNQLSDLSQVRFPNSLAVLDLAGNQLSDLFKVKLPSSLTELNLSGNQISDLSKPEFPESLKALHLQNIQISDTSKLRIPSSLTILDLSNNKISDTSKLKLPNSLEELHLNNNQISDLSSLKLPNSLKNLYIYSNQISDLSKLKIPQSLSIIVIVDNPCARDARMIEAFKAKSHEGLQIH